MIAWSHDADPHVQMIICSHLVYEQLHCNAGAAVLGSDGKKKKRISRRVGRDREQGDPKPPPAKSELPSRTLTSAATSELLPGNFSKPSVSCCFSAPPCAVSPPLNRCNVFTSTASVRSLQHPQMFRYWWQCSRLNQCLPAWTFCQQT